jgi:hypothetical protein
MPGRRRPGGQRDAVFACNLDEVAMTIVPRLLLASWCAIAGPPAAREGALTGVVVNASRGKTPAAETDVVVRVRLGDEFIPFHQTKTDARGRFRFDHLPVGKDYRYLSGANRGGVHYPGPPFEVTPQQPWVSVELQVWDSVAEPNPLVIRRHDIALRPEQGVLFVTESILVENPTATCYVGRAAQEGSEPVTLRLAIPPDFERTTFHKEFFGRRFSISKEGLVTAIAWPPGQRELSFTYTLPNKNPYYRWQRPLDLPCSGLRVRVENANPGEVACNLKPGAVEGSGILSFDAGDETLPAGHTISVELGRLPVPFMAYARWAALAILVLLAAGTSLLLSRRRRSPERLRRAQRRPEHKTSLRRAA